MSRVLRQDIAPVGTAYLVFLIVFVWYARRRRAGEPRRGRPMVSGRPARPTVLRTVAVTVAVGYLAFAVIIAVFYLVLGGQPRDFVPRALAQGSVLAFGVVLPAFVLLTWAEASWRHRRGRWPPTTWRHRRGRWPPTTDGV